MLAEAIVEGRIEGKDVMEQLNKELIRLSGDKKRKVPIERVFGPLSLTKDFSNWSKLEQYKAEREDIVPFLHDYGKKILAEDKELSQLVRKYHPLFEELVWDLEMYFMMDRLISFCKIGGKI